MNELPSPRKAVTTKEITGHCIETIPVGTPFVVINTDDKRGYSITKDLSVTHIFNDEFVFTD
jgi:hypothetical protein